MKSVKDMKLISRGKTLCLLLIVLTLIGCGQTQQPKPPIRVAAPEDTKPLFCWEVSSPTNTVYLFGSIHVANDGMYPLAKEIEQAFSKAKTLVVEIDANNLDQAEMMKFVSEEGMYKNGAKLTEHLSKEAADQLQAYCKPRKLSLEMINNLKPWLFSLRITMSEVVRLGYDAEKGIDKYFLARARKTGTPVAELESAEEQMRLLGGLDSNLQELFLLNTLRKVKNMKAQMATMISAWKSGDDATMHKIVYLDPLAEMPKLKPLLVKMLDDRNVKMTAKIEKYLQGNEPVFVVVGAGHFPGEMGILKLLEKKGFKVKQMHRTE